MRPQLTIEAFADWCDKQPAEKEYNYGSITDCAFCQYLQSLGFESVRVSPYGWRLRNDGPFAYRALPDGLDEAVRAGVEYGSGGPLWTFGALSLRLRQSSSRSAS